jgi:hypothetical protein
MTTGGISAPFRGGVFTGISSQLKQRRHQSRQAGVRRHYQTATPATHRPIAGAHGQQRTHRRDVVPSSQTDWLRPAWPVP